MRAFSIVFVLMLIASVLLPLVPADADGRKQVDQFASMAGVTQVKGNNVDVTYTGRTWKDSDGDRYEYVARIHQAPIYNDDGTPVDCSWHGSGDAYAIVNNIFSAQVIGAYITVTYEGQSMSWNPVVRINSKEYVAKSSPKLLAVDPINENYLNNTLEWDYGVCVRHVRVIEGLIQETWTFASDPHGTVWIKDNMQKSKGFEWALEPYGYDADGNAIEVNSYKQVSAKDMAEAKYPVVIDPTEVFVTSASDAYLYGWSASYATAQSAATGTLSSGTIYNYIGQVSGGGTFKCYRTGLYFDTSALPDGATISSANLSLWGATDSSVTNFNISVTNGQPTYPHDPLETGDYDKTHYSGIGNVGYSTTGFVSGGYNNITLNATGMGWISLSGTTKLLVVSTEDINASQPTTAEYVIVSSYEQGAGYRPYLEVTYDASGPPTVTTNPATYVTGTTARLNGYLNNDGGEACDVSFEYLEWYNASWSDVFAVTIDPTNIDSDLTNFPVLVTGDGVPDNFWTTVNASGLDIVVTDSDLNKRPRELVSIDTGAETMELYFNASTIDDTNETHYYVWYGGVAAESNDADTWTDELVYHMNDDPDTSTVQDSTSTNADGTKSGAGTPAEVDSGLFDGDKAQSFGADKISFSTADPLNLSTANDDFTISVLAYLGAQSVGKYGSIISFEAVASRGIGLMSREDTARPYFVCRSNSGQATSSTTSYLNQWVWITGTYNKTTNIQKLYINGVEADSDAGINDTVVPVSNTVGGDNIITGTGENLNGKVAEVRVALSVRSASRLKAESVNLLTPSTFYTIDDSDAYETTTAQSKNTGQSWYDNITGLTKDKLYGYRATGSNGNGDDDGDWVLFSTEVTLGTPSNTICNPTSTSIALTWTLGGNTSTTYIRWKEGSYPTDAADGNLLTITSDVGYTHSSLTPGHSYYYRLWGYDAGDFSASSATLVCTTLAGSDAAVTPEAPVAPDTWTGDTDSSVLEDLPIYDIGNSWIDTFDGMPHNTGWMIGAMGLVMVSGFIIYSRSKNLVVAILMVMVFSIILSIIGLLPMWFTFAFAIISLGFAWRELR